MEAELACSTQWFHQQSPSHHRPNIIPAQMTLGRSIVTCLILDTTVSYPDADSNCLISLEASTLAPRRRFSTKSPKWSFKTWSQSYCFLLKNPPTRSHHSLKDLAPPGPGCFSDIMTFLSPSGHFALTILFLEHSRIHNSDSCSSHLGNSFLISLLPSLRHAIACPMSPALKSLPLPLFPKISRFVTDWHPLHCLTFISSIDYLVIE